MHVLTILGLLSILCRTTLGTTPYQCGVPPISETKRIVGGTEATEHEFPWQAAMVWRLGRNKGEHICGGSLVSKNFVLTAAHCFEHGEVPRYYNFTLGEHVYSTDSGREQKFTIKKIIVHPSYDINTHDNDLALVQLDRNVKFTQKIYPVCLPHMIADFEIPGKSCTVTGWGANRIQASSDFLKKADVPIVKQSVCNDPKSYGGKVTWNMFCAGHADGIADSCGGDSGGPLQCKSANGNWVLSGVTSWGVGCGVANKYGVYVRVRHFLDWIKLNINLTPTPPLPHTSVVPPQPKTPVVPPNPKTPVVPPNPKTPVVPPNPKTPVVPPNPKTPVVPPNPKTPVFPPNPKTPVVPPNPKTPVVPPIPKTPVVPPIPKTPIIASKPNTAAVLTTTKKRKTTKQPRFTLFPKHRTIPPLGKSWNKFIRKLKKIIRRKLKQQRKQ